MQMHSQMRMWKDPQLKSPSPPEPVIQQKETSPDLETPQPHIPALTGVIGSTSCCGANENVRPRTAGAKTLEASGCPSCSCRNSRKKFIQETRSFACQTPGAAISQQMGQVASQSKSPGGVCLIPKIRAAAGCTMDACVSTANVLLSSPQKRASLISELTSQAVGHKRFQWC